MTFQEKSEVRAASEASRNVKTWEETNSPGPGWRAFVGLSGFFRFVVAVAEDGSQADGAATNENPQAKFTIQRLLPDVALAAGRAAIAFVDSHKS